MELTITQKRDNPLLERTEVYFTIAHEKSGTPQRAEIRKAVAGALGGQGGIVILDWARAEFGRTATRGYAKVYKAKERAMEIETRPVLVRNGLKEAVKKAEAPAAAPQAPAPPRKEAPKAEPPKKEEPKPEAHKAEPPKKGEAPAKAEKKESAPPKKETAPAKKEAPAKEKKPAAKKEGK